MHFYEKTEEGIQPRHFVQQKSNPAKKRPSRKTDATAAAKEGRVWYPSVTGIIDILAKPQLENWKIEQHLKTVWSPDKNLVLNADKFFDDFDNFAQQVKDLTQLRLDEAPKAGTNIHKVIEDYLFTGEYPVHLMHAKIIRNIEAELKKELGKDIQWEQEKRFVNQKLGYAGTIDLVSDEWVIDFKSKQTAAKFKPGKMAYEDHARQLAAYGYGISTVEMNSANIFVCLETGEIDFHIHEPDKIGLAWEDFCDCLNLYHRNVYSPFDSELIAMKNR